MTGFGDPPRTTEKPWKKNPWSSAESLQEEIERHIHNLSHRCVRCKRSTDLEHLDDLQRCPDCR